jgi:hypothetical protein
LIGDDDQQIIPAMKCIFEAQLVYFTDIIEILAPGSVLPLGEYFTRLVNPGLFSKIFLFKCYADTALTVVVRKRKYEVCDPTGTPVPPPPPVPNPPPIPSFPVGVPIVDGLSPDEGFNPGDYEPFPGDTPGSDTGGETCTRYSIVVSVSKDGNTSTQTYSIWGEYGDVSTTCDVDGDNFSSSFGIQCRGGDNDPCGEYRYVPLGGASGGGNSQNCYINVSLLSVTPI